MTNSTTSSAAVPVRFDMTVLDTPDPPRLAEFYAALLGWQVERADDDWITISGGTGTRIAFQLAPDHVPPTWPDAAVPQQVHIDFAVADIPAAAAYAESLGATRVSDAEVQQGFVVFRDPSGHTFCLCD